jgi:hypothetical protein
MSGTGTGDAVEIEITMASTQPPQGEVAVQGGHRQCFVGWLQLLHVLVEAVAPPHEPGVTEGASERGPEAPR